MRQALGTTLQDSPTNQDVAGTRSVGGLGLAYASDLLQNEDYQIDEISHHLLYYGQAPEDGKRPQDYAVDP